MRRIRLIDTVRFLVLSSYFLLLTLYIFRKIFEGTCLTGTDSMSTIYGPAMQATYGTYYSTWDYFSSVGFLAYPSPSLAATNQLVLGFLQISPSDFAKIMLLGSFWLSGMISFYVLRHMTKSDLAAFIGSLVYVGNGAFVNQIVEGHFGFIYAYPFLILIFFLFYEAYTKGITRKTFALPVLLLFFGGAAAPHMVLLASLMILGFMVIDLVASILLKRFEKGFYKVALAVSMAALLIFPLAYIMFVLGDSSVLHTAYTIEEAGDGASNLLAAISIGGSETTNAYAYYGLEGGQWLLAVTQILAIPLFICALLSAFASKYRTITIPLLMMIVLNIFVARGPDQAIGGLFTFLFDNLPLIDSFRSLSRFLLLNAVFYSILIAITVSNWGEISRNISTMTRAAVRPINRRWLVSYGPGPSMTLSAALIGMLMISSLAGIVVISNGEVVRSFDPPREYAEPFDHIATLESNGLSYKIFTLPMTTDIYQHPYIPSISGYNYPRGTTLDPGTYLPGIIDQSPMAHSTTPINYWSDLYTRLENRVYGYKDTLTLLGASAGVKYVVEQFYADEREKDLFTEMNNGTILKAYQSGAQIIGVNDFSEAIKAQNGLIIGSGDLDTLYLLLGMGVFDPVNNTYASLGDLNEGRDDLLEASGLIVVQNGDIYELAYDLGLMDNDLMHLVDEVNPHRGERREQWVIKMNSGSQETSVITSGSNNLTIYPNESIQGSTSLMVRAMFGPQQGDLHVYVNGEMISNMSLEAPFKGSDWVRLEVPDGIERIDSITFGGSVDYQFCEVFDAAIISEDRLDQIRQELRVMLEPYASKVGYIFTPMYIYNHDPDALLWYATEGSGIMSLNKTSISIPFESLFDNQFNLSVYAPDWGARSVDLDGQEFSSPGPSSGAYDYDVTSVTNGSHVIDVFADGAYCVGLLPNYELDIPRPDISYQRLSPTEYRITVKNASGPFILKFSEGPNKFWTIEPTDNSSSTWFRTDYLANGFLVNGSGDLELTMKFTKQGEYESFLNIYLATFAASTAAVVVIYIVWRRPGRAP